MTSAPMSMATMIVRGGDSAFVTNEDLAEVAPTSTRNPSQSCP